MTAAELRDWLRARQAILSSYQASGVHVVTIVCLDPSRGGVEVSSMDFERALMLAQYAFDLTPEKRVGFALGTITQGGLGKC